LFKYNPEAKLTLFSTVLDITSITE
jgi:hypothetical protein